ncbi:MAG: hypothetical protein OMM_13572, partial [Candidatus Magnetoglobus multicellularis str. Araruama]
MISGKYASTILGQIFRQVMQSKKPVLSDIALYPPSNHEPASFIAEPLIIDGEIEFVVALQLLPEGINQLMQTR